MFPRDQLRDLSRAHICSSFCPGQWPSCKASPGPLRWPLTRGPATLRTGNPGSLTPSAPTAHVTKLRHGRVAFRPSPRLPRLPWSARCASVCVPSGLGTRTHPPHTPPAAPVAGPQTQAFLLSGLIQHAPWQTTAQATAVQRGIPGLTVTQGSARDTERRARQLPEDATALLGDPAAGSRGARSAADATMSGS